jgi:ATPase subunit of ABC transporter with duplicated ATPase domains
MSASLVARSVSVSRADRWVLHDVDVSVGPGRRIGLVGPNGVGKSTLLATLAGALVPDAGSLMLAPPDALVGWLRQEPDRDPAESVRAMLHRRTGVAAAQVELDAATAALAAGDVGADDRYAAALDRWLAAGAADLDARIGEMWADLGLGDELLERSTGVLSGGEAARASLAALLLSRFDVYLLDEPTNDLDLDGLARLERWVVGLAAGLVVVSHDRRFLERVVTHVVEIDEFDHTATEYAGGWDAYLAERELARQHAWERFEEFDTKRRGLAQRAQREREWASQGLGKVKRSDETDKHIRAFKVNQTEQLAGRAARTERAMERLDRVDKPRTPWELRFTIGEAGRSGDVVVRCDGLVVERGTFRLGPLDLLVEAGERVALVGANGSGKTTLLDAIVGRATPSAGSVTIGPSVVVGEIEQARGRFLGDATLVRALQDATGSTVADARTLLAKFGLVGAHVDRPAATLSPGERTRAAMALLMATGTNLLVLDEPTNHLDLPAIEQLEQAVEAFAGTVLLITHDRVFLEHFRATRRIELAAGRVVLA